MNESINDEAVYRTAPAKPGLLIKLSLAYCTGKEIKEVQNSLKVTKCWP
jgi:hypothetical protein